MSDIGEKVNRWRALCTGNSFGEEALREAADECERLEYERECAVTSLAAYKAWADEARIAKLEETLRWYAEGRHMDYSYGHPSGTYLKVEPGTRAQKALGQTAYDNYMAASQALGNYDEGEDAHITET